MKISDLVISVSKATRVKRRDVKAVINEFLSQTCDALVDGDSCWFDKFFTLYVKERKARRAMNMCTKESIDVPSYFTLAIRPSKGIKERLNQKTEKEVEHDNEGN